MTIEELIAQVLAGFPQNRFQMDLYYDGECFIYTDGTSKFIVHPNYKMKVSRELVAQVNFITATRVKDPAEFTLPKYQKNIKSWPHVTSCNRVKETKRQGRIAHHLYRFCPTAMPPFRTSWLYLVSPFTLQRYE